MPGGALQTSAQTLTGGINELLNSINSLSRIYTGISSPSTIGNDGDIFIQYGAIKVQYVRFTVTLHRDGSGKTMQCTGPFFINASGSKYSYPSGTTYTSSGATGSSNETPLNAINTALNGKMCGSITYPCVVTLDLKSAALDTSIYNRVQLYTSNDTATTSGRNPQNFQIEISLNGTDGITACNVTDCPSVAANYSVLYTSNVFIENNLGMQQNGSGIKLG